MESNRVRLILLRERSAKMCSYDLEDATCNISAIRDCAIYQSYSSLPEVVNNWRFLPLPILQSSLRLHEYVFVSTFCTAVASDQEEDILRQK
jgi:hypothetical protein